MSHIDPQLFLQGLGLAVLGACDQVESSFRKRLETRLSRSVREPMALNLRRASGTVQYVGDRHPWTARFQLQSFANVELVRISHACFVEPQELPDSIEREETGRILLLLRRRWRWRWRWRWLGWPGPLVPSLDRLDVLLRIRSRHELRSNTGNFLLHSG